MATNIPTQPQLKRRRLDRILTDDSDLLTQDTTDGLRDKLAYVSAVRFSHRFPFYLYRSCIFGHSSTVTTRSL